MLYLSILTKKGYLKYLKTKRYLKYLNEKRYLNGRAESILDGRTDESARVDARASLHVESARADGRARLHVESARADGRMDERYLNAEFGILRYLKVS